METELESVATLLGELRLKHWGGLIEKDLGEMNPDTRSTILSCLNRWAQTEKAERRATLIATLHH